MFLNNLRYLRDNLLVLRDTVGDRDLDADVCRDVHTLLLALRDSLGGLDGLALLLRHCRAHLLRHSLAVLPTKKRIFNMASTLKEGGIR